MQEYFKNFEKYFAVLILWSLKLKLVGLNTVLEFKIESSGSKLY